MKQDKETLHENKRDYSWLNNICNNMSELQKSLP